MPRNVLSNYLCAARNRFPRRGLLASAPVVALWLAACTGPGQHVRFADLPASERNQQASDYIIGVGDSINIRVYEQDALSGEVKVRTDGKVALQLIGELMVAGKRPLELSKDIELRLKEFIVTPRVTVNVTISQPITVTVLGEVNAVGALTLDPPARLAEALARAGGLSEFADESRIFVLRQFPSFQRIRFEWDAIARNEGGAALFPLRTGDIVVVE